MYFKDEEEYKKYLDKNKIDNNEKNLIKYTQNFFEFSKEGDILLRKNNYQDSQIDVEQYCACKQWILLNDGKTMCLLKNSFGDIYRDLPLKDYYIALYNNILMPQIANQLQNESAIYYFAKIINKENQKDNRRYILTLDFKNKDENLLLGEEILGDYSNTLNINEILEKLENYLKEKNIPLENIRRIKTDFIKQSFFNKFINQMDEHNKNWGILINENTKNPQARIAPVFDLDCCCGINKKRKIQRVYLQNFSSLTGFIKEFGKEEGFKNYIKEVIQNFNLNKAFENSKELTNVDIPEQYKNIYSEFFSQRIQEVKQAYYSIEKEKEDLEI